jgi:hypothetical protein
VNHLIDHDEENTMDNINPLEERLLELLRRCSVKLVVPGGHGTGFFVAPGMILTCAHVVEAVQKGTGSVTVSWKNQSLIACLQNFLSELHPTLKLQYPDLALLKVDALVNANHPCVYLHTDANLDDKIYSYGYTDEYPIGDPSTFISEGWTDEQHLLLKFKEGQARSGLSGAAALNRRTGSVCGVMKRSRGTETDLGGRAIPTRVVFENFPELETQQQKFHQQDRRWYDCINQQQREILGLLPPSQGPVGPFKEWATFYITTAKSATKTAQDLLTVNGDIRPIEYINQEVILDQQKKNFEDFRKLIDNTQQLPPEIALDNEELRIKVTRGIAQIEKLKTCIHTAPCQDINNKFISLSSTLDDLGRHCKIET